MHSHFGGDFRFGGRAQQLRREVACDRLHLLVPLAQIARGPVELAQAVQNCALDAVLRVTGESHLLCRIVLRGGVEQTQYARVHQIVQIHMHGQILMNTDGNRFHQWQVFQNHRIASGDLGSLDSHHGHTSSLHGIGYGLSCLFISSLPQRISTGWLVRR